MIWFIVIVAVVGALLFLANRRYTRRVSAPHHRHQGAAPGGNEYNAGSGPTVG